MMIFDQVDRRRNEYVKADDTNTRLIDFLERNKFTGTVRATDVFSRPGKVIVSSYSAAFKSSDLVGFSATTSVRDGKGGRILKLDDELSRRELLLRLLLKPLSDVEITEAAIEETLEGNVVNKEDWESIRRVAKQIAGEEGLTSRVDGKNDKTERQKESQ